MSRPKKLLRMMSLRVRDDGAVWAVLVVSIVIYAVSRRANAGHPHTVGMGWWLWRDQGLLSPRESVSDQAARSPEILWRRF